MPAQSLLNGTLTEAIDGLAKRAVVARRLRGLQKEAFGWEDVQSYARSAGNALQGYGQQGLDMAQQGFDSARQYLPEMSDMGGMLDNGMNWAKDNPEMAGAAIGAGGGALFGGLSSLGQDEEDRAPGRSAMTGAMAGGALGLGGGLLSRYAPQLFQQQGGPQPQQPGQLGIEQLNQAIQQMEEDAAANGPSMMNSAQAMALPTAGMAGSHFLTNRLNPNNLRAGAEQVLKDKNPAGYDTFGLKRVGRNSTGANLGATARSLNPFQAGARGGNGVSTGMLTNRDVYQLGAKGRGPMTAKGLLGRGAAYAAPTLLHWLANQPPAAE